MNAHPWLWLPAEQWGENGTASLPPDEAHHAVRVLRIAPGDLITLADGRGRVATGKVIGAEASGVDVEIESETLATVPAPTVTVWQAIVKGPKLDSIVQQLAEIGVTRLGIFPAERSVPRWDSSRAAKAVDRLNAVARASGKQSRRAHWLSVELVPGIEPVAERAVEETVVALDVEASLPLREALPESAASVTLVVGPEGGLTPSELDRLIQSGASSASLGSGVLRTEHAGPIAAALVLYRYGAIG